MKDDIGVLKHLPPELEYLIRPALNYGRYQTYEERGEFFERATEEEMEELRSVAEHYRLNKHADLVSEFLDDCPITDFPESAKLYFLFGVMDEAGLPLDPEDWNTVDNHIKSLKKRGSYRLASERAIAARFLGEFGEQARPAIPVLREALRDEDLRVRVWAHYALSVIEGDRAAHEAAVRKIFAKHNKKDSLDCFVDDVGAEADAVLEKFRQ